MSVRVRVPEMVSRVTKCQRRSAELHGGSSSLVLAQPPEVFFVSLDSDLRKGCRGSSPGLWASGKEEPTGLTELGLSLQNIIQRDKCVPIATHCSWAGLSRWAHWLLPPLRTA